MLRKILTCCTYKRLFGILLAIVGGVLCLAFMPLSFWMIILGVVFIVVGVLLAK